MGKRLTNQEFIQKATKIHSNKYDYSLVDYKAWNINIVIICKNHGKVNILPNNHLNGRGCPKCGIQNRIKNKFRTEKDVIGEFFEIHGNNYDYSRVHYEKMIKRVDIICNKCSHIFKQTPNNHISKKQGCPKCAGNLKITFEEFINRSNSIHNNFYDYPSNMHLKNNSDIIRIECPKHGFFRQTVGKHLQGQGCSKCVHKVSKAEQELYEFIKLYKEDAVQSDRTIIKPYEIDIYIPSLKLAFEYNGTYWHSEKFRPINHREDKSNLCRQKGINLLHIEEEDWNKGKKVIKEKVKSLIIK